MCQRVLNANDPEPAVGSVVLDVTGAAWQRWPRNWSRVGSESSREWAWVTGFGPVTLIHDGGAP